VVKIRGCFDPIITLRVRLRQQTSPEQTSGPSSHAYFTPDQASKSDFDTNAIPTRAFVMRIFYRVQHRDSFTKFDPTYGFDSNARYIMAYDLWINKDRIEGHLDWNTRSREPTPFISVFGNFGMTMI
jgi:hypothetical protein